jgi:uncharacterized membrane protein
MRLWILPIAALSGFAFGCNKSPEGGTPGTHATFKLTLPTSAVAALKGIKQGTSETYDASIERGSDFKKDVKLSVTKPEKVDVKLSKDVIKASEDTKFTITVAPAKDAAQGEHSVKVTATPEGGGEPTAGEFKIKVEEHK